MKGYIISLVIFLTLVGGAVFWMQNKNTENNEPTPSVSPSAMESTITSPLATTSTAPLKNRMHLITLTTNYGEITFETYDMDAPKAVSNFITLSNKGFYNGVIFHRVIKDFMIQGGDPTGTGRGGPGYTFEDELNSNTTSYKTGYKSGVVAMANSGPDTNGSQFFIMHKDYKLPNNYTIFGKVVQGQDVVDKIAVSPVDTNDRPIKDVIISKVKVADKP